MTKSSKIGVSILGFILGVAAVCGGWVYLQFQPTAAQETKTVRVVVKKGEGLATLAADLQAKGLIKNALVFRLYSRFKKLDTKIQSGSYTLSTAAPLSEIAVELTKGTEDVWVTLLEGWRREEIASYLASQTDLTEFSEEDFLTISAASEGMLFPDSYLVPKEITAKGIFTLLTDTFEKKFVAKNEAALKASNRSLPELVTLASLVQREAKSYQDMRHVAGILENRMQLGMPLQVDATLQYIRGFDTSKKSWWTPPLVEFKKQDSAYNTYLRTGLPPHAIANPGLDALKAALDPVTTDDVFYIHAPSGTMYYAQTLEEHNQNVARYLR